MGRDCWCIRCSQLRIMFCCCCFSRRTCGLVNNKLESQNCSDNKCGEDQGRHTLNANCLLIYIRHTRRRDRREGVREGSTKISLATSGCTHMFFNRQRVPAPTLRSGYDRLWLAKCTREKAAAELQSWRRTVCRLLIMGRACGSIHFIFMSQMAHVVIFMHKLDVQNTRVTEAVCKLH